MPSGLLVLIGLFVAICGITIFVDRFYKMFPRAEKLSGLQIWAIWGGVWLLVLLIAVVQGSNR